jgi:hypothetical protein
VLGWRLGVVVPDLSFDDPGEIIPDADEIVEVGSSVKKAGGPSSYTPGEALLL